MYSLSGIKQIKKVLWKELKPGLIFAKGVHINGYVPYELRGFPVLTKELLNNLSTKYQFLNEKMVLIVEADLQVTDPVSLSAQLQKNQEILDKLNLFREDMIAEKQKYAPLKIPVYQSQPVDTTFLKLDQHNSFSIHYTDQQMIPSFFNLIDLQIKLSDLLTGQIFSRFHIPLDKRVQLHLVVDYSYSMNHYNKHDYAVNAVNFLYRYINEFLLNTSITLYVFSDKCRVVDFPLTGKELPRGETSYSSFFKAVLKRKAKGRYNKIILLTDGIPSDFSSALRMAEQCKVEKIDYSQIIYSFKGDLKNRVAGNPIQTLDGFLLNGEHQEYHRNDQEIQEEYEKIAGQFTQIAEVCGGNQIILKVNDLIGLLTVEFYDRYLGLLSLTDQKSLEQLSQEFHNRKRVIKPFHFKKI
ncbi:MAG: VWA domain-containing protein [Spirochaetes bacterium]|nr:VWA domain-containing protein [Spirochaetota bacterium]